MPALLPLLAARWVLLTLATVAVAALLNRYAPRARPRLRRVLFLLALFVILRLLVRVVAKLGWAIWLHRLDVSSGIVQSFVIIGLVVLCAFELVLPLFSVRPVSITSDLLVGVAYIVATLVGLREAGMDLSSLVATSAIVSGVLALSLQATLGNILGGVALQLDGSIHVGDWVQLPDGKQGQVRAIRWRHTVVETRDWDTLIVPNATLLASQIQILGKRAGESTVQHRMTFMFNVGFEHAPQRVIDVVTDALNGSALAGIATEPRPHCLVADLAKDGRDSFGYYLVRYWLIELPYDDRAQSLVRTRVYAALERAGIALARPRSTVYFAPAFDDQDEARQLAQRRAALSSIGLFAAVDDAERSRLAPHLERAPFHRGERITRAGEASHWMYLLTEGQAEVRTPSAGNDPGSVIAQLTAPDFFGEMGLMTGAPRTADVVALTDVDGYRLAKSGFESLVKANPRLVEAISSTLAKRRVALDAVRDGLNEARGAGSSSAEVTEERQLLSSIQQFFGLKE